MASTPCLMFILLVSSEGWIRSLGKSKHLLPQHFIKHEPVEKCRDHGCGPQEFSPSERTCVTNSTCTKRILAAFQKLFEGPPVTARPSGPVLGCAEVTSPVPHLHRHRLHTGMSRGPKVVCQHHLHFDF